MACYRPLKAYRAQGGRISFKSSGDGSGWSDRPIVLPCGQCIGCRIYRAQSWALRVMHEAEFHDRTSFITLTYDKRHLPANGSLVVSDWQLFAKAVRYHVGPFRFYACGEYGDRTGRPHFHAALFGADFADDRIRIPRSMGSPLYLSGLLSRCWKRGHVSVGELSYDSAEYVARYVCSKLTGDLAKERYGERRAPFNVMSRNPGIGSQWFEKYMSDVYPEDECRIGKRRFRPPRFYDERLAGSEPDLFSSLKAKRHAAAVIRRPEEVNDAERELKRREAFHERRLAHFGRSLDDE